ncbi:hypothetical protein [Streptomyces paludis]|uniref:Uncharacterized protein n=1 Tax=Streptomyces paludis TaxID=2282738 RepID=A0A345HWZ9_9ACTN|nr:hypothetical protein [Streptomyces paludis]AXG81223.1 hypothetical protein DVK44_29990 [Streptomyces paludis]
MRYLRLHRPYILMGGLAALAACQAVFGSQAVAVPVAAAAADSTVHLRMLLAVASAALAVGSLHSGMQSLEAAATDRLRRFRARHLMAVTALAVLLSGGIELVSGTAESATTLVRAQLVWTGLAILSGRLFGWLLAWILPLATVFPLTYLGWDTMNQPRWWNLLWQDAASPACWVLAISSLILGAGSFLCTPWRRYAYGKRLTRSARNG